MPAFKNKILENVLRYSVAKQRVISENISNLNTKGYKRKDVEFKEILDDMNKNNLKVTNSKHIQPKNIMEGGIIKIEDNNTENLSGFNNVNVDEEMAEMAQNTIMFKFASRKLSAYYKSLQKVIRGN